MHAVAYKFFLSANGVCGACEVPDEDVAIASATESLCNGYSRCSVEFMDVEARADPAERMHVAAANECNAGMICGGFVAFTFPGFSICIKINFLTCERKTLESLQLPHSEASNRPAVRESRPLRSQRAVTRNAFQIKMLRITVLVLYPPCPDFVQVGRRAFFQAGARDRQGDHDHKRNVEENLHDALSLLPAEAAGAPVPKGTIPMNFWDSSFERW